MILRRDNVLVGQELEIMKPKDHHTAEKSSRSFRSTGVYLSVFIYFGAMIFQFIIGFSSPTKLWLLNQQNQCSSI